MISIASDLILKQVDLRIVDVLSEYLDEKGEEYLGFRREEKAAVAERLQKCGALDKRSNE